MPKKTSLNKGLQALLGDVASPKTTKTKTKTTAKKPTTEAKDKNEIASTKLKQTNTNQGFRLMRKSYKSLQNL